MAGLFLENREERDEARLHECKGCRASAYYEAMMID